MPSFSNTAASLYKRFFGAKLEAAQWDVGVETVLDGNSAVAITETLAAEVATLGGSFPSQGANLVWQAEQTSHKTNVFGDPLSSQGTEGPRGALAAAMGQTMAGKRVAVFMSGQDIAGCQDLMATAAGRRLSLVLHLNNRAVASQGSSLGSSHEAVHLSADSGFFTLFAANVQEAVDFTLIARRVAELTLTPALVVMDGEQTALAAQDVHLPSPALVKKYLGAASEQVPVLNDAQKLLFGETRRRIPRWHDLDHPVSQGALQGTESFGLSSAAQSPFFDQYVSETLKTSFEDFEKLTGRSYGSVSTFETDKAQLVLVAQGAAIETAKTVCQYLQKKSRLKVGVLGIHTLRPLPGPEIAKHLTGKKVVAVLERVDTPLASDAPLMRELRACLDHAAENNHFGIETHPGYPTLRDNDRPRLRSVIYGLGGLPLRTADLITLCTMLEQKGRSQVYLGIDFANRNSIHPKRQVLLDALHRAYPELDSLGVCASEDITTDLDQDGATTIAIHRISGQGGDGLAMEVANLLYQSIGGQIRYRPALSWDRWNSIEVDQLTYSINTLYDQGDETLVDVAVITTPHSHSQLNPLSNLRKDGLLLVASESDDEDLWKNLPDTWCKVVREKNIQLYCVPVSEGSSENSSEVLQSLLLAGLMGALLDSGKLNTKLRRLLNAYDESLKNANVSDYETRQAIFATALDGVRKIDYRSLSDAQEAQQRIKEKELPMAVRLLGGERTEGHSGNDHYDSLPKFWDQVGVLYRDGQTEALSADPFLATGTMPPLSSTFRDHSDTRSMLPSFDPIPCTACGHCWSVCPDSAIGVVAITPASLIETGIRLAGAAALRPIASKLASRISSQGRKGKIDSGNMTTAAELLNEAFAWLQEKAPFSEDRMQAIQSAFDATKAKIATLPLATSDALFQTGEKEKKDNGELLSLVINPNACKGCGLCVANCEPQALTASAQTAEAIEQARECWRIWEQTPDTPSTTIERISKQKDIGPMAAVLMSRHCQLALAGGDGAEAGSGEKIAVRLALGSTEYQQQPLVHRLVEELQEAKQKINDLIRDTLAEALPTEDLEAMAAGLSDAKTRQIDLSALTTKVKSSGVDAARLKQLIELAQGLKEQHWCIAEGQYGLGRARYGVTVAPGSAAAWAGAFPHNPFQVPVNIDMTGDAAQIAAGLLHGQLDEAGEALRLLRIARQVLKQTTSMKPIKTLPLTWSDMEDDERQVCPPLWLIGTDETLGGRGLAQITWLLNSGLPIKILVLAGLDFGLHSFGFQTQGINNIPLASTNDTRGNLGLLALAQRNAYVAQTSIAEPSHYRQSVREALRFGGPALIRVHAPSPEQHGFAMDKTIEQAKLALASRAIPLFRYNPENEGVFGSRLNLEGNPALKDAWTLTNDGLPLTPIHWALSEQRFAACFSTLAADAPAPTELMAYLELDDKARSTKTPFINIEEGAKQNRVHISPALVKLTEEQSHGWQTLQELAGIVTPFTERVAQEAADNVANAHQAELEALKKDYEARILDVQNNMQSELAQQMHERLMTLAGYNASETPNIVEPEDVAK